MCCDIFLKFLVVMVVVGVLFNLVWVNVNIKMMILVNFGGGWDGIGCVLGEVLCDVGVVFFVIFENKGGVVGVIGLV